jgi:competence protein ComEC
MKKRIILSFILLWMLSLVGCQSLPPTDRSGTSITNTPQSNTENISQPARAPVDSKGVLTFSMINIGKGDALLISTPQGAHYMVDTGEEVDYPRVAQALATKGVTEINAIFLTHGHFDHMGGLVPILSSFPVGKVYISAIETQTYSNHEFEDLCSSSSTAVEMLKVGDQISLDRDVNITVLAPLQVDTANENNNSLVMMLTYGSTRYLLMGDAGFNVENALMTQGIDLHADVLKSGHHGQDDATSEAFLQSVSPSYVILTGNPQEDSGSPGKRVNALLKEKGIASYASIGNFLTEDFISDGTRVTPLQIPMGHIPSMTGLVLDSIDRKAEKVVVKNTGNTLLDLTGCWILSEKGNEMFFFPRGTLLPAGGTLSVVSGKDPPAGDFVWTKESVWKAKKADTAMLYDRSGNLLSTLE